MVEVNQGRTQTRAQLLADRNKRLRISLDIDLADITKLWPILWRSLDIQVEVNMYL